MHEVPILIQKHENKSDQNDQDAKDGSFHRLEIVFLRFQFRNLKLASRRR